MCEEDYFEGGFTLQRLGQRLPTFWTNVGLHWQKLLKVGIRWRTLLKIYRRLEINVGDSYAQFVNVPSRWAKLVQRLAKARPKLAKVRLH